MKYVILISEMLGVTILNSFFMFNLMKSLAIVISPKYYFCVC